MLKNPRHMSPADTRTRDDSCIDMEEADDCGAPIQSDDANPPSTGEIALKRKKRRVFTLS